MKLYPLVKHLFLEHKIGLHKSVPKDSFDEKKLKYTKLFIDFVCSNLELKEECDIILINNRTNGMSTGGYNPDTNKTYILIKNRHVIDIFRSIAHELKHQEQRELGLLKPDSGDTGSKEENIANAFAGKMMREFSEKYPEIYDL